VEALGGKTPRRFMGLGGLKISNCGYLFGWVLKMSPAPRVSGAPEDEDAFSLELKLPE
jgi:hypothetical protein